MSSIFLAAFAHANVIASSLRRRTTAIVKKGGSTNTVKTMKMKMIERRRGFVLA